MRSFTIASALALLVGLTSTTQGYELSRSLGIGYGAGHHAGACCGLGGLGHGGGHFGCCEHPLPHHDHLWADYCASRTHHGGLFSGRGACCETEHCCDTCCEPPGAGLRKLFSWCRCATETACYEPEPCCDDCCSPRFSLKGLFNWNRDCCEPEPCCEPDPCCDDCCGPRFSLKGLFKRNHHCCEPVCCEPEPCCDDCCGPRGGLHKLFSWCRDRCAPDPCCEPEPCCCDCCRPGFSLKGLLPWRNRCCVQDACGYGHESYQPAVELPAEPPVGLPEPPAVEDEVSFQFDNRA